MEHVVKLGYGIYKGQKKMSVLGRKEYVIDYRTNDLSVIDEKIHYIHEQIESLVYDKYFGNFVNMKDDLTVAKYNIQQSLLETAKQKGCVPICCVCHDPTQLTTTNCHHSLCLDCYQRLPPRKTCPMCRCLISKVKN